MGCQTLESVFSLPNYPKINARAVHVIDIAKQFTFNGVLEVAEGGVVKQKMADHQSTILVFCNLY